MIENVPSQAAGSQVNWKKKNVLGTFLDRDQYVDVVYNLTYRYAYIKGTVLLYVHEVT